ncbi:MAG: hypothetical protein K2Q20_09535 [Phycisphaerales bacterium]|nr:hypothetical protein [Phycisphaerales bacterium]
MLGRRLPLIAALVLLSGSATFLARPVQAQTVAKQFTYQGYLENNGVPYTGTATFDIYLYSTLTGGTSRDRAVVNSNVPVSKGVFSIVVNFGDTDNIGQPVYNGTPMYLEIVAVLPGGSIFNLAPRQLIQPAPVALSLPNVTTSGANVGVGIANPTAKLHVGDSNTNLLALQGSSAFGSYLSLNNTSPGGENWAIISTGASNGEGAGKLLIADQSPRVVIDTDGNVGIGTNVPTDRLTVIGTSKTVGGAIRYASDATANPARTFEISSGGGVNLISNSDTYMLARGGRKFLLLNTDADSGNVGIGTSDPTEKLHVNGNIRAKVIIIDGGSDLAESYDVAPAGEAKPIPGMVVSIDPEQVGKLRISTGAYDRTVAGIISGADGIAPGLILGQKGTVADGEFPIANAGRVWCYVDADAGGPVVPGDMLTTSPTPGHAMKATDSARTGGAIMGKAMSRLERGRGLVLVLVSLQ